MRREIAYALSTSEPARFASREAGAATKAFVRRSTAPTARRETPAPPSRERTMKLMKPWRTTTSGKTKQLPKRRTETPSFLGILVPCLDLAAAAMATGGANPPTGSPCRRPRPWDRHLRRQTCQDFQQVDQCLITRPIRRRQQLRRRSDSQISPPMIFCRAP